MSDGFDVHDVSHFTFGEKAPLKRREHPQKVILRRKFEAGGMQRSVEGILLVHLHNHPHVLLLQEGMNRFKLPGGRLKPEDDEIEGLKRKLNSKLSIEGDSESPIEWTVGPLIATWYRPTYEEVAYPYLPPHVITPKEVRKVYLVPLQEKCAFAVPANLKLLAVPLFDLYNNSSQYGHCLASIPEMLSHIKLNPR